MKFVNNWLPLFLPLVSNGEIVTVTLADYITGKTQKLKRAKEEAQAEIKSYREEREKQFIDYQREVSRFLSKQLVRFSH